MCFFDTHLHIPEKDFVPDAYYARGSEVGVKYLLACSSGLEDSRRSADFAASCENVYFSAGVHPHDAKNAIEPINVYKEFASMTRFVAIGEIGLDFYYGFSERDVQIKIFDDFLTLALELNVPALVHCRDKDGEDESYRIAYDMLSDFAKSGGSFVLHAFAGTTLWAEKFIEQGAYFGFGGMITFKRADNIRELAEFIPLDRILLETDAPYLAPVPFRGKENHPAYLPYVAERLSIIKNMTCSECAEITTLNAFRFLKQKRMG